MVLGTDGFWQAMHVKGAKGAGFRQSLWHNVVQMQRTAADVAQALLLQALANWEDECNCPAGDVARQQGKPLPDLNGLTVAVGIVTAAASGCAA